MKWELHSLNNLRLKTKLWEEIINQWLCFKPATENPTIIIRRPLHMRSILRNFSFYKRGDKCHFQARLLSSDVAKQGHQYQQERPSGAPIMRWQDKADEKSCMAAATKFPTQQARTKIKKILRMEEITRTFKSSTSQTNKISKLRFSKKGYRKTEKLQRNKSPLCASFVTEVNVQCILAQKLFKRTLVTSREVVKRYRTLSGFFQ